MHRSIGVAVSVAMIAASSLVATSAFAAEPAQPSDLAAFTCKEIMRYSGQDRDIAISLAHGYVLGKKGTTKYDIDRLAQITDRFIDYCLDNPTHNALASFEKIAK